MRMFTVRRAAIVTRQNWGIGFSLRALPKIPSARRGLLTQSYACGPREVSTRYGINSDYLKLADITLIIKPPLIDSTVGDHFASIVSQYGDREAYVNLILRVDHARIEPHG